MNTDQIQRARGFAHTCHEGQFRHDNATPYIIHPEVVASIVEQLGGGEQEITVAWLHDTMEDCVQQGVTHPVLAERFDLIIADAVEALTHREGESYPDSIARAMANPIAHRVKIADNLANLSDSPSRKQVAKYAASLIQLLSAHFPSTPTTL